MRGSGWFLVKSKKCDLKNKNRDKKATAINKKEPQIFEKRYCDHKNPTYIFKNDTKIIKSDADIFRKCSPFHSFWKPRRSHKKPHLNKNHTSTLKKPPLTSWKLPYPKSPKIFILLPTPPYSVSQSKIWLFTHLTKNPLKPPFFIRHHRNQHPRSKILNLSLAIKPHPHHTITTKSTETPNSGPTYVNLELSTFFLTSLKPHSHKHTISIIYLVITFSTLFKSLTPSLSLLISHPLLVYNKQKHPIPNTSLPLKLYNPSITFYIGYIFSYRGVIELLEGLGGGGVRGCGC